MFQSIAGAERIIFREPVNANANNFNASNMVNFIDSSFAPKECNVNLFYIPHKCISWDRRL